MIRTMPGLRAAVFAALAAAFAACAVSARADDVAHAPDAGKQTAGAVRRPSPPPELQRIRMWEGSWVGDSRVLASTAGPESRTKSSHRFRTTLGGMHLEGEHEFTVAGTPVHGQSIWSWNPETKQYQVFWLDDSNPTPFVYSGQFLEEKKLVVTGAYPSQGRLITERLTYVLESEDRFTLQVESNMMGAMSLVAEETLTRAAPAAKRGKKR